MQLIIPAFNEASRLPATLDALRARQAGAVETPRPLEVIVVDNRSSDATARIAREADSLHLPVRVVFCATRGKGAAVRAGFAASDADIVAFMDADGATGLEALADGVRIIEAGADIAVASRAMPASLTWERHSKVREAGAGLYRRLTRSLVPGVVDTQCGFKVFRGDLARRVLADTRTNGFSFDVEVLARARAEGARIEEFPVTWVDVPGSTFNPALHGLSSFVQLGGIAVYLHGARVRRPVRTAATPVPLHREVTPADPVGGLPLVADS
jgi:dolichyl-phosphate beta-glucosyltransferase